MPDPDPDEIDKRVAAHVAALIPDGATIQMGVGGLPVAVCRALDNHRDSLAATLQHQADEADKKGAPPAPAPVDTPAGPGAPAPARSSPH